MRQAVEGMSQARLEVGSSPSPSPSPRPNQRMRDAAASSIRAARTHGRLTRRGSGPDSDSDSGREPSRVEVIGCLLLAAIALCACKPRVEVRADPVDAARDTAPPITQSLIVRGGEVIDLAGVVTKVLRDKPPLSEVSDERRAFLYDRDFVLRAYELASGRELWTKAFPPTMRPLLIDARFVYVVGDSIVTAYRKETGEARTLKISNTLSHVTIAKGLVVGARIDRVVGVIDPTSGESASRLTLPFSPIGWRSALQTLIDGETVCAIGQDPPLQVLCFDTAGGKRARVTVDLHKGAPAAVSFNIVSVGPRYVLFGSHSTSGARRSAVVRLADGSVIATVEDRVAAIVEREDGSIAGLLVVEPELRLLDLTGKALWTATSTSGHHDGASAVARGNTVFIDTFPQFSSGSALEARDLHTGALVWKGLVEALPVSHSEYFNDVRLSLHGERLLLRGDESSVITTQLFNVVSGKRELARSHHR